MLHNHCWQIANINSCCLIDQLCLNALQSNRHQWPSVHSLVLSDIPWTFWIHNELGMFPPFPKKQITWLNIISTPVRKEGWLYCCKRRRLMSPAANVASFPQRCTQDSLLCSKIFWLQILMSFRHNYQDWWAPENVAPFPLRWTWDLCSSKVCLTTTSRHHEISIVI